MKSVNRALVASAICLCPSVLSPFGPASVCAQFADTVVAYDAGSNASPRHNDPSVALGQPSRLNPFGDAVEPFNPPYHQSQIVSVGTGGFLTVSFAQPIANRNENPFGLDLLVFGGSGFVVTNAFDADFNWIGTPATDGSLFGGGDAIARVSVSSDGLNYFQLDPALAPAVEALFPSDGAGDFQKPVDPTIRLSDFAGLTLEGIRERYLGSGGGTGLDISWARDGAGQPVRLDSVRFVRIDVLGGKVEIDAFGAAVSSVPEPGTMALLCCGGVLLAVTIRRR